ncbi:hypothetical protein [Nocardia sp. NPDC057440]|uniref:hypothetical protein n=1 Tax=Nocardia sp. NPDC057440 TaxID=3346134 RepID=UPI00366CACA0
MITDRTLERSLSQPPSGRFEAGTGSIVDAVGLDTAIEDVEGIGIGIQQARGNSIRAGGVMMRAAVVRAHADVSCTDSSAVMRAEWDHPLISIGKARR